MPGSVHAPPPVPQVIVLLSFWSSIRCLPKKLPILWHDSVRRGDTLVFPAWMTSQWHLGYEMDEATWGQGNHLRPIPNSNRPFDIWSTVATSSATRNGYRTSYNRRRCRYSPFWAVSVFSQPNGIRIKFFGYNHLFKGLVKGLNLVQTSLNVNIGKHSEIHKFLHFVVLKLANIILYWIN